MLKCRSFLFVQHISVSKRNATHLIRSRTILFHDMLQTFSSFKGRLYLLRSSWTLFAQFLSAWYVNISWYIVLLGHHFAYLEFVKNASCIFPISYWIGKIPSSRNNSAVGVDLEPPLLVSRNSTDHFERFEISFCVKFEHNSQLYINCTNLHQLHLLFCKSVYMCQSW